MCRGGGVRALALVLFLDGVGWVGGFLEEGDRVWRKRARCGRIFAPLRKSILDRESNVRVQHERKRCLSYVKTVTKSEGNTQYLYVYTR